MARLVLGVSGSIAAYKACDLASKLVQGGHHVDVIMTRAARTFVQPLSFAALTHNRVLTDENWGRESVPHDHLRVTSEAALVVVAPCTANLLGKFAHGIADDILSTTWLTVRCPRILAPAMNPSMWENARVQANARTLEAEGVRFVGPAEGWLSEAQTGVGRMSEPADILAAIESAIA